jgi:hypothetical protein
VQSSAASVSFEISALLGIVANLERKAEPLLSREFPMALYDPTAQSKKRARREAVACHVPHLPVGELHVHERLVVIFRAEFSQRWT